MSIKKICFGLILVTSFLLIYTLNYLHPLFGDDWMYSMLPDGHTRVEGFGDILYTQYEHYFTWGGRSVVHIIAQTLLLLGKTWSNVLNSMAYVALTLVIYVIANRGNTLKPSLLLGINLLIWFFQPAFGSTILWVTGSANYLWGTLIIFSFLIPYNNILCDPRRENNVLKVVWMFVFGVIAGWTNENMAVALVFIVLVFCVIYKKKHEYLPLWMLSGLIGAIIGSTFMLLAPGNYARVDMINSSELTNDSGSIRYLHQFITSLASYHYYALSATFVYFVMVVLYRENKMNEWIKLRFFISIVLFLGALVATLAMSASPIFPGRASFGINVLLFVSIAILYSNLDFSKKILSNLTAVVLTFGMLYFCADYYRAYKDLSKIYEHTNVRSELVQEKISQGQTNIILDDRIDIDSRFIHYYELTPDFDNWHNRIYSNYYEIESIIVK